MRPQLNKTFGLSEPKLNNPFAENKIGGSAFGTKPVGDSGILIKTKDPIITTKKPFTFTNPSQSEWESRKKLNENLIKAKEEAEKSWWQKQTKTAKTIYVSVGVLAVGLIGYLVYKKISKK
jgi:hypothetical protein